MSNQKKNHRHKCVSGRDWGVLMAAVGDGFDAKPFTFPQIFQIIVIWEECSLFNTWKHELV